MVVVQQSPGDPDFKGPRVGSPKSRMKALRDVRRKSSRFRICVSQLRCVPISLRMEFGEADNLKKVFKVSDQRYWRCKIDALADGYGVETRPLDALDALVFY